MKVMIAVAATWLAGAAGSAAEAERQLVFVVDATAQMNGKLGDTRKIDLVRKLLSSAATKTGEGISLTLWAYGIDPARKCEDKKALLQAAAGNGVASQLASVLAPLTPQAARAPALATVQSAVQSLGPDQPAASVILLTGSGDDCTGDICSAAAAIHNQHPSVTLDIVGLGLTESVTANFNCAAAAMGGSLRNVKSARDGQNYMDQLIARFAPVSEAYSAPASGNTPGKDGALQAADDVAPRDEVPSASAKAASPPPSPPLSASPVQMEPNVVLNARLSADTGPLDAGVTWYVFKTMTTPTGQVRGTDAAIFSAGGGQAKVYLPAGHYIVKASLGFASASSEMDVTGARIDKTIVLNAGVIEAKVPLGQEAAPDSHTMLTLFRGASGVKREELGRSSRENAAFYVDAGVYVIKASSGMAQAEAAVHVEPGKSVPVSLALDMGLLRLDTDAKGMPQAEVWHRLIPDAARENSSSLTLEGPTHTILVSAGDYKLVTIYGNAVFERKVTVPAGKTDVERIAIEAGKVQLAPSNAKEARFCQVSPETVAESSLVAGRAAGSDVSFVLKPGTYTLTCWSAGQKATAQHTRVQLVAGETQVARLAD